MEAKETLWHINWGDGDNAFVLAPNESVARERLPESKDRVNFIVRLDSLYQIIFKAGKQAGIREAIDTYTPYVEALESENGALRLGLLMSTDGVLPK